MKDSILQEYHATRDFSDKAFRSACYAAHISLFFETQGNVLACCQNTKYPLGNVAEQSIDEIWNGKKVAALRKALEKDNFSAGCQFCEWQISVGNYLGTFTRNFENFPVESRSPEWPTMMEFSISNTCNLECIMCNGTFSSLIRSNREQLPPLPKAYGDRFFNDLRKYLPHLRFAKFLGGEPFLSQETYRIWEMMIEDGISFPCHVTTNGTQYNPRLQRILDHIPISFSMSMDGFTKETVESVRVNAPYETVMENFERFHAYARERKTYIGLTFCLMRQNWHEFGDYLLFADSRDCEVVVNTVREPPHCSLYTLPVDELAHIADALEKQGESLVERLGRNRGVWKTHVGALRLRVSNQRESSRAPFITPLSLIVIDLASLNSVPESDRMTVAKATDQLSSWAPGQPVTVLACDKDDKLLSLEGSDTLLGLAAHECIGLSFEEIIKKVRAVRGDGKVMDLHRSGHYVDRTIDFLSPAGDLLVARAISVPRLNEFGLHGGSVSVVTAIGVAAAGDGLSEEKALAELREWSGGAPVSYLFRDLEDKVTSLTGGAEETLGLSAEDWLGRPLPDLHPILVERHGSASKQGVWRAATHHVDRVAEYRRTKRLLSVRSISRRTFNSAGRYLGWTTMVAAVPIDRETNVGQEAKSRAELEAWCKGAVIVKIASDVANKIVEIGPEGRELGLTEEILVGRGMDAIPVELGKRFGPPEIGPARVGAVVADRSLKFVASTGPVMVRGITWPRFDSDGRHVGSLTLLACVSVNATNVGRSVAQSKNILSGWLDGGGVIELECGPDRIVRRVGNPKALSGPAPSELEGQTLDEALRRLRPGVAIRSRRETWDAPIGLSDEVVVDTTPDGPVQSRVIIGPSFDPSGAFGGWTALVAIAVGTRAAAEEREARMAQRLRAWAPEGVPMRLTCDAAGVIRAVDAPGVPDALGVDLAGMIGRGAGEVAAALAKRFGAERMTQRTKTAYFEDQTIEYQGPGGLLYLRAISLPRLGADGAQEGTVSVAVAVPIAASGLGDVRGRHAQELAAWCGHPPDLELIAGTDHAVTGVQGSLPENWTPELQSLVGANLAEALDRVRPRDASRSRREDWGAPVGLSSLFFEHQTPRGPILARAAEHPLFDAAGGLEGWRCVVAIAPLTQAICQDWERQAEEKLSAWAPAAARLWLESDERGKIRAARMEGSIPGLGIDAAALVGGTLTDLSLRLRDRFGPERMASQNSTAFVADHVLEYVGEGGVLFVRAITVPRIAADGCRDGSISLAALVPLDGRAASDAQAEANRRLSEWAGHAPDLEILSDRTHVVAAVQGSLGADWSPKPAELVGQDLDRVISAIRPGSSERIRQEVWSAPLGMSDDFFEYATEHGPMLLRAISAPLLDGAGASSGWKTLVGLVVLSPDLLAQSLEEAEGRLNSWSSTGIRVRLDCDVEGTIRAATVSSSLDPLDLDAASLVGRTMADLAANLVERFGAPRMTVQSDTPTGADHVLEYGSDKGVLFLRAITVPQLDAQCRRAGSISLVALGFVSPDQFPRLAQESRQVLSQWADGEPVALELTLDGESRIVQIEGHPDLAAPLGKTLPEFLDQMLLPEGQVVRSEIWSAPLGVTDRVREFALRAGPVFVRARDYPVLLDIPEAADALARRCLVAMVKVTPAVLEGWEREASDALDKWSAATARLRVLLDSSGHIDQIEGWQSLGALGIDDSLEGADLGALRAAILARYGHEDLIDQSVTAARSDHLLRYRGAAGLLLVRALTLPRLDQDGSRIGSVSLVGLVAVDPLGPATDDAGARSRLARWSAGDAVLEVACDAAGIVRNLGDQRPAPFARMGSIERGGANGLTWREFFETLRPSGALGGKLSRIPAPLGMDDEIAEFQTDSGLLRVRTVAAPEFDSGALVGWRHLVAAVLVGAAGRVEAERRAADLLLQWSGGTSLLRLVLSGEQTIIEADAGAGEFLGLRPADLVGRNPDELVGALGRELGPPEVEAMEETALFFDQTLAFAGAVERVLVRALLLPTQAADGTRSSTCLAAFIRMPVSAADSYAATAFAQPVGATGT